MTLPPPTPGQPLPPGHPGPPPPKYRDPRPWYRRPNLWIWATGAAVVVVLFAILPRTSREEDDGPGGGRELCAALRDSENNALTTGDWERITGWQDWEIRRYVADRCPEQLDRFL